MIFSKTKNNKLFTYYAIGGITVIFGYLIFIIIYTYSSNISLSLLLQFVFTFFFKFKSYKLLIFKRLIFTKFLLIYSILYILNNIVLKLTQSFYNVYILQLIYMASISLLFFLILRKKFSL